MSGIGAVGMSSSYIVPISNVDRVTNINTANNVDSSNIVKEVECQTCKTREYVDGSDENVSFKTPGRISPESSYSKVRSHEQEHVSNAISKSNSTEGAKLISASVTLKMGVCTECGKSYVAGGVTNTTIKYEKNNPYDAGRKVIEGSFLAGQNIDKAV